MNIRLKSVVAKAATAAMVPMPLHTCSQCTRQLIHGTWFHTNIVTTIATEKATLALCSILFYNIRNLHLSYQIDYHTHRKHQW